MRTLRLALLVALLAASCFVASPPSALAASSAIATLAPSSTCSTGTFDTGAKWMICLPAPAQWNGDLVVYAHGYTAATIGPVPVPLDFQNMYLDGAYVPDIVTGLGYAFAATSYRSNGLAILEGVKDVRQVAQYFPTVAGRQAAHTYLVGVSEGGLVTTLALEQSPNIYSGGLAACGPIGDFQAQTNYLGDFRVLFDYFYPGVLPNTPPYSAINIPDYFMTSFDSVYTPAIGAALSLNPAKAAQLINTSRAAIDPANVANSTAATSVGVLWYSAFATNDAKAKLGGNPFDNMGRVYSGSLDDRLLNASVARFSESPVAAAHISKYKTSGRLARPLVTLHTTLDPVVPFWHELLYARKAGLGHLTPIPVIRYGHCAFTRDEVLSALGVLVFQVTGRLPASLPMQFNLDQARSEFGRLQRETALPK